MGSVSSPYSEAYVQCTVLYRVVAEKSSEAFMFAAKCSVIILVVDVGIYDARIQRKAYECFGRSLREL